MFTKFSLWGGAGVKNVSVKLFVRWGKLPTAIRNHNHLHSQLQGSEQHLSHISMQMILDS